jgi:hypothetical protein
MAKMRTALIRHPKPFLDLRHDPALTAQKKASPATLQISYIKAIQQLTHFF